MRVIASAIGPTIAGMYLQMHQSFLNIHEVAKYFPSSESYNLISLTAILLTAMAIVFGGIVKQRFFGLWKQIMRIQ